jgi:hypothetical protein
MYELTIVADYNDADFDESTSLVSKELLDKLIPLLEKILSRPGHNFNTLGLYELDDEEKLTTGPYEDYPDEDRALIARLIELVPFGDCDYGIHTIVSASYCEAPTRTMIKGSR